MHTGQWSFIAPILAVLGMAVAMAGGYDRRLFIFGMAVLFCAAGMFRWDVSRPDAAGDPFSRWIAAEAPEFVTVEGRVQQSELFAGGDDYLAFVVEADAVHYRGYRRAVSGLLLVRWNAAHRPVFVGDSVTVRGEPTVLLSPVNWNVHSNEDSLRRSGIHSMIRCRGGSALTDYKQGSRWSPFNTLGRFRHALSDRLSNAVPESARAFVFAVWLGDRSHLSRNQQDSFVRSGTAHILAVSGVHVSIVFVTVSFVLGRFIRVARYRAIFIMVAVAVFALTAGARVATIRAAMMIAVYVMADVFDRERDAPTALSIAGFVFLLWEPELLFDGGAQLSFLSIASILLFCDRISGFIPWFNAPVRQAIATPIAVQLLPLPVAAGMFHLIPRYALFANLIVVPLLGIALWLCLITSVTAFVSPPLALLFGHATAAVAYAIQWIAEKTAALPFSTQSITKPTAIAAFLYWSALGVTVVRLRLERRHRAVVAAALLFGSFIFWRPFAVPAQLRVLDVGHGDASVFHAGDGSVAVIDGGDHSEYVDMGSRVLIPTLSSLGVSHIDYLFVSHSDRDHLGGLTAVVNRMSVGRVIMGPADPDNADEQSFLTICAEREIPVVRAFRGKRFRLGSSVFSVLHPPEAWHGPHSRNDLSLVLRLDWEGPRVLFTGDIEEAAERLLSRQDVRAPILKAPHHGSDSSSSRAFIEAVDPRIALISAGNTGSRVSNPQAVIDRYGQAGVDVWRTNRSGGLWLRPSRDGIWIKGARPARGYPGASIEGP